MKHWIAGLALGLLAGMAQAENLLSVSDGWVRWVPPVTGNSAAYFRLHNEGKKAVELVSVESPVAKAVEMHTTLDENGLSQMKLLGKIAIPAGDSVEFNPGGNHLMLIGLKAPLQEKQAVNFTLHFADGETLQMSLPVQNPLADKQAAPHDHSSHHHHH